MKDDILISKYIEHMKRVNPSYEAINKTHTMIDEKDTKDSKIRVKAKAHVQYWTCVVLFYSEGR